MTTVQIIGVSVAGAAVLLLIIALLVTWRRRGDDEEDQARPTPLDAPGPPRRLRGGAT